MSQTCHLIAMKLTLASLLACSSFFAVAQAETVTPVLEHPVLTTLVTPDYPMFLRQAGVSGEALVEGVLGKDGRMSGVRVVQASNPAFAGAARTAVTDWRFSPARQNGEPVSLRVRVPVTFRLESGGRPAIIEFGDLAPAVALAQ